MTREEFHTFGEYMLKLWPKLALTEEQREIWYHRLQHIDIFTARDAAGAAYAADLWATPKLADLLAEIKRAAKRRVIEAAGDHKDFSPEFIAQVRREEAEEAALLAGWTDQQCEDGRREIIRMEPCMKEIIGTCKVRDSMLAHFLVERFIHRRATVFPGGRPVQVSLDEYWAAPAHP